MIWIKKLGLIAIAICLLSISVLAARGDVTVSEPVGSISGGMASYSAMVTNNSGKEAVPVMVLVWYEDGVMMDIQVSSQKLDAGAATALTASMSGVTVTDATQITGFVWEDKTFAIPVALEEIERFGNGSAGLEGFEIAGLDDTMIQIDDTEKTIEIMAPIYDAEGEAVDIQALETTVVTENAKTSVKIGDVVLVGEETQKSAAVDYSLAKTMTITAEDGTEEEFTLQTGRVLYENFETGVISGSFTAAKDSSAWDKGTGDFAIIGAEAQRIFKTQIANTNISGYTDGLSIGVEDISGAQLPASETVIPAGNSAAEGNALRITKDTHSGKGENTGCIQFIPQAGQMPGLRDATYLTVEYDVAYDFNVQGPRIGGTVAGLDIIGSAYRISSDVGDSNTVTANKTGPIYIENAGSGAGRVKAAGTTTDQWNHIKAELDKNTGISKFYVNETLVQEAAYSIAWPSGNGFLFGLSAQRCVNLWLDNISISYR